MFRKAALAATMILAAAGFARAQAPEAEENPLDSLKKILAQMQAAEKMLARMSLERGSEAEKKIVEDIEKLAPDAVKAEDETARRLADLMDGAQKKMADIVAQIQKFLDDVRLSESQGRSEMEMPKPDKPKESKGEQKEGQKKDDKLEKMRDKDESKGESRGGEEETEKGGQADKSYTPRKKTENPADPAKKADGSGRWGALPAKIFNDIVHPEDFPKPRKYESLIQKYFEMLSKKSKDE